MRDVKLIPKFVKSKDSKQESMLFSFDKIKFRRETENITQSTMSKAIGIRGYMYSNIARDEKNIRNKQNRVIDKASQAYSEDQLKLWLTDQIVTIMDGEQEVFIDVVSIAENIMSNSFTPIVYLTFSLKIYILNQY